MSPHSQDPDVFQHVPPMKPELAASQYWRGLLSVLGRAAVLSLRGHGRDERVHMREIGETAATALGMKTLDYETYLHMTQEQLIAWGDRLAGIEPVELAREIPAELAIQQYLHCALCLKSRPENQSPRDWAQLEVGFTPLGLQVFCRRHEVNVVHIDFEGFTHPSNSRRVPT